MLHEQFENQGTKRTYRSGSQAYDVISATAAYFWQHPSLELYDCLSFVILPQSVPIKTVLSVCKGFATLRALLSNIDAQKWSKEQTPNHDGLVRAEEVAKFMLLRLRTARNKHGKVQCCSADLVCKTMAVTASPVIAISSSN